MDPETLLSRIFAAAMIIGGIGYAVGQFFSQRAKGSSDALSVAMGEIAALQVRADRQGTELADLGTEVLKLRTENESLRSLLTGGTFLAEQIRVLVADEVEKGAHLTASLVKGQ
jgi:hypothetical protein